MKAKLIGFYAIIGICFSLYRTFFGKTCYESSTHCFGVHLSEGVFWILHVPVIGEILAHIIAVIFFLGLFLYLYNR